MLYINISNIIQFKTTGKEKTTKNILNGGASSRQVQQVHPVMLENVKIKNAQIQAKS